MEKKIYLIPSTQTHGVTIDVIMQNEISNINSGDSGLTPGGGGNGDGNAKETDPWEDEIWEEKEASKNNDIVKSLW